MSHGLVLLGSEGLPQAVKKHRFLGRSQHAVLALLAVEPYRALLRDIAPQDHASFDSDTDC